MRGTLKSSSGFIIIVAITLMAGLVRPQKINRIASGVWGGEHIRLEVSSGAATVEFDCAHGTIEGPLTVDANGDFSWKGRFAREHGGPIRNNEEDSSAPAIYSGSIDGQTMKLTVRLASEKEPLDTFVLIQGKEARLRKCR